MSREEHIRTCYSLQRHDHSVPRTNETGRAGHTMHEALDAYLMPAIEHRELLVPPCMWGTSEHRMCRNVFGTSRADAPSILKEELA